MDNNELKSVELYYNEIKGLIEYERNRKRDLETRAGIFVALIGVFIGIMFSNLNFNLWESGKTPMEIMFLLILQIINVAPIIILITSFWFFISVLKTYSYNFVQYDQVTESSLNLELKQSQKNLFNTSKTVYQNNFHLNEKKAHHFNKGVFWLKISIISYGTIYILFNIVKEVL